MKPSARLPSLLFPLLLAACAQEPSPRVDLDTAGGADLLLLHGRIATMDPARPSATALAVRGARIVAVGSDAEVMRYAGERTRIIDLAGRFAMPGFIEGHGHFLGLGQQRMELDLRGADSFEAIVQRVAQAARAAQPGAWIVGRGWHQNKWQRPPVPNVEGTPLHAALSAVSPANPVALVHASGHALFANQRALDLAGITAETPDPEGGTIVRGPDGQPTGLLRENAEALVWNARAREPQPAAEQQALFERRVELATEECLAKGITSFQDAGTSIEDLDRLHALAEAGRLRVRLWAMARDDQATLARELPTRRWKGVGGGFFTLGGIKLSIDGALGTHGAWLLAPYHDLPSTSGLNTANLADAEELAGLARELGLQFCVHAIGDRANREMLDLYARVLGPKARELDHRWRIEHAQHLDPADVPRFAELGVIASMQGVHCTSDGPWVPERIGEERARSGAYLWRSLLDAGAVVSNGTDTPVEDVDPLPSLAATVTRRLASGRQFFPEQCLTRDEALHSYTTAAAFAAREEELKGSLTPGKYADVVVLDQDLRSCPEQAFASTRVHYTIVGGRIAYQRP